MTTRDDIARLFKELRRKGIKARMSYQCCSSCAGAAAVEDFGNGAPLVYFHRQDDEAFTGRGDPVQEDRRRRQGLSPGDLASTLYMRFGIVGGDDDSADRTLGGRLVAIARAAGLRASWDGDPGSCVEVAP
jgi:hypothetical protein